MRLRTAAFLLLCALGLPLPCTEPTAPGLRLPAQVRPLKGRLELTVVPDRPTFTGTATYELQVSAPVDVLWVNATNLRIRKAELTAGGKTVPGRTVPGDADTVGFRFPARVEPGAARLVLEWEGEMDSTRSQGLYRVQEGPDWYAYTFFEPIDARRAFPCFDEPARKIPWTLVLHVPQGQVAAANTAAIRETPGPDGLSRIEFAESKPLPPYLVAWMVGPFDIVPAGTAGSHGTPLRFIVPKGRGPETAYAAQATPRLVGLLEAFFAMPYPFGKLDVAVVPRYWGTMEHPGLVAMGQPLTLIKPGEDTPSRRRAYAGIAVHELGHYWFGDVVTMAWWDDTWLNEGMTTWLDARMTDLFEPAWRVPQERLQEVALAMKNDALPSAKRVRQPVSTKGDIQMSFDNALTYFKGNALMSMAERWIGPDRFRDIVRGYIRKHAWGNATSEDWLKAVEDGAGPQARDLFQGFISQPGLPVVSGRCVQTPAGWRLELTQRRFLASGAEAAPPQTWTVPVGVRLGRTGEPDTTFYAVLAGSTGLFPLPGDRPADWLLLNADAAGYYRVAYTPDQLAALRGPAAARLTLLDRIALLKDVQAQGETGALPFEATMALAATAAKDPDRLVVTESMALMSRVPTGLLTREERHGMARYVQSTWGPRAEALGWSPRPGEGLEARQLRNQLVPFVALRGRSPALAGEAATRAEGWLKDRQGLDPDLVGAALRVAARQGGRPLHDRILAELGRTQVREDRARLFAALGAFLSPELLQSALAQVLAPTSDLRESMGILAAALGEPETRPIAWAWLKANFEGIVARSRSDELCGLVVSFGETLWSAVDPAEFAAFLQPRVGTFDGGTLALTRAQETIQIRLARGRQDLGPCRSFLASAAGGGH